MELRCRRRGPNGHGLRDPIHELQIQLARLFNILFGQPPQLLWNLKRLLRHDQPPIEPRLAPSLPVTGGSEASKNTSAATDRFKSPLYTYSATWTPSSSSESDLAPGR